MQTITTTTDPAPAFFADGRRSIELPGDNRLLSEFASDVGDALSQADIFYRGGSAFTIDPDARCLRLVTPDYLRTWTEKHLCCYRIKKVGDSGTTVQIRRTMTLGDADGVLASPQFLEQLQPITRVNPVSMPVLRASGWLELLAPGYDTESRTFTCLDGPAVVAADLDFATSTLNDLLREFCWADGERSKAVALSAMLTVYGAQLLPEKSLRPAFIIVANSEGAGKTLLTKCATVPVLGSVPTGSRARDDDEMRKLLLSTVIEGRHVLLLDNCKGHLSSESLEAFLSCQNYSGRVLGQNRSFTGENNVVVFITGNGMTLSPDMRRRSLFVELHLDVERAEDREFKSRLEVPQLLEKRTDILSSMWTLTKSWFDAMRPPPSRSHSAFPDWADIIGGIVEFSGLGCPLEPPAESLSPDTDGADMRALVRAIGDGSPLGTKDFNELVTMAQTHGLFERLVGSEGQLDAKARSSFGRLLQRYDRRLIGNSRFTICGKGRDRHYEVHTLESA